MDQVPTSLPTTAIGSVLTALVGVVAFLFRQLVKQQEAAFTAYDKAATASLNDYKTSVADRLRQQEDTIAYERREKERAMQDAANARALLDRLMDSTERTVRRADQALPLPPPTPLRDRDAV